MENPSDCFQPILAEYTRLTGREAPVGLYDHSLFEYVRAGFTADDMRIVVQFIMNENKRNHFQYSLRLGVLLRDLERFNDLLQEAKVKERNRRPKPTPKEKALSQLRPIIGENLTATGASSVQDIIKKITKQHDEKT